MDRSWINCRLFSKAHLDGVSEFMDFVSEKFAKNQEMLCPCRRCLNRVYARKGVVKDHLYINGMASTYIVWINHGESTDAQINEIANHQDEHIGLNEDVGVDDEEEDQDNIIPEMLEDLHTVGHQVGEDSMFAAILDEMKKQLYHNAPCTRFSFVVKLLHIKSFYRIRNVAFTAIMKLLSTSFPACSLPSSYDEAKKVIRALGLGYDSIHVCPNNCVLFRKEYAELAECLVCGASRWKDSEGRKKIPHKVLRHFPLIPRLKRMFGSIKTAESAQWHTLKRQPMENELSHPVDGEAWKDFDRNMSGSHKMQGTSDLALLQMVLVHLGT